MLWKPIVGKDITWCGPGDKCTAVSGQIFESVTVAGGEKGECYNIYRASDTFGNNLCDVFQVDDAE